MFNLEPMPNTLALAAKITTALAEENRSKVKIKGYVSSAPHNSLQICLLASKQIYIGLNIILPPQFTEKGYCLKDQNITCFVHFHTILDYGTRQNILSVSSHDSFGFISSFHKTTRNLYQGWKPSIANLLMVRELTTIHLDFSN